MDKGAWRATVNGIATSQTKLKLLSTHACIVYYCIQGEMSSKPTPHGSSFLQTL